MQSFLRIASALYLFCVCTAVQYTAFDTASASSVYSGGGGSFEAKHALSTGASYWCSAGGHGLGQVVSWTGVLSARRQAVGLYLSWAYSPNEIQILTSPDGQNFVESACWRPSSQNDAAYVEHVMFDQTLTVRAVTVVMRGPRAWGYFALNSVTLLSEPGTSMLVSGLTAAGGEMCAVATNGRLILKRCIEAIAAGTGHEILRLGGDGLLMSTVSNECAALEDGDTGGAIVMINCRSARQADDGRATLRATANGQIRLALGNNCVVARGSGLVVQDCSIAEQSEKAADKLFFIAVPEFDPTFADAARTSAGLAIKTASRLEGLLGRLEKSLPLIESCIPGQKLVKKKAFQETSFQKEKRSITSTKSRAYKESDVEESINSMIGQLKIEGLADLIARARSTLGDLRGKF